MLHRFPSARRPLSGLAVATLAAALLAGCGSGSSSADSSAPTAPGPSVGTKLDKPVSSSVLSIPMVDAHGHRHTLGDFAGKVVVISDSMTLCQETCPIDTSTVVQTARDVEKAGLGDDVEFLTITVDPHRDTPKRLRAYRRLFGAAPADWMTLTGTTAHIHQLWKHLGVYWKRVPGDSPAPKDWMTGAPLTYDVEHSDEVFFFGGHQHERFLLEGPPHISSTSAIPKTLYTFMTDEGHHNTVHPKPTAWTAGQALHVISWLSGHQIRS
ncbi:MAG: SCO family protein [Nocardioidaceae bacterium]